MSGVDESKAVLPKPPGHWVEYAERAAKRAHPEVVSSKFSLRLVSVKSLKPSQTGEDYDNSSSRNTAKNMKEVEKEGEDAIGRSGDFYPVVVDKSGNILDGNHRHAAHVINGYKHIWALVQE